MMPPRKVRSVVVPKTKRIREVTPINCQQGPLAKRTWSNASDTDIVMTITQPIDANRSNKTSQKPKANPAHSRAKEASNSCSTVSLAHPAAGVQHTCNAVPTLGQHQPSLQQTSPPWWAWGPPQPPAPWNWNMWTLGTFHQMSSNNATNPQQHPQVAPPQMFTPTNAAQTQMTHATLPTTTTIQQQSMISSSSSPSEKVPPSHLSPAHKGLVGDSPKDTTEELEEIDSLISALSFTTAPGNHQEPLFSMHVSNSIKKCIWAG